MKNFEVIENLKAELANEAEVTKEAYKTAESQLVETFGEYVVGQAVECTAHGSGTITAVAGETFDAIIVDITFGEMVKRFSLLHIMTMHGNVRAFEKPSLSENASQTDAPKT